MERDQSLIVNSPAVMSCGRRSDLDAPVGIIRASLAGVLFWLVFFAIGIPW